MEEIKELQRSSIAMLNTFRYVPCQCGGGGVISTARMYQSMFVIILFYYAIISLTDSHTQTRLRARADIQSKRQTEKQTHTREMFKHQTEQFNSTPV